MYPQGAVAVGKKVEGLLSRVVELEEYLDPCPRGVAEPLAAQK